MRLKPKILDRYLCREFVATLVGVLTACAVVLLVAKIFEEFDNIMESHVPLVEAAKYFLFVLPFRVLEVVPLATMLAVIFSVGTLAQNREMLAITSSGRSPYRSAAPVLAGALVVALLALGLNETFVPYCQARAEYYEDVVIKGRGERSLARRSNIFDKGIGNTFFMVAAFDARTNRMDSVLIFEQSADSMVWRYSLKAESADLVREDVAPDRDLWRLEKAVEHFYDEQGRPVRMVSHTEPLERELEAGLDQYLATRKEPEQMNLAELSRYIRTLKMRGLAKEEISVYLTDWHLKLAFPFSTVILAMIAFALSVRVHTASLPLAFGVGIFLTMVFYALAALGQTLGHIAVVPPSVGALGPLALFLGLGIYLIRRSGFAT